MKWGGLKKHDVAKYKTSIVVLMYHFVLKVSAIFYGYCIHGLACDK